MHQHRLDRRGQGGQTLGDGMGPLRTAVRQPPPVKTREGRLGHGAVLWRDDHDHLLAAGGQQAFQGPAGDGPAGQEPPLLRGLAPGPKAGARRHEDR